ncbi:MAG: hypothetical protein E5Y32_28135 [Mesorhizobium sp.]|uniref:hypothetical protein n=1 Tax=Mesorhizobium sp. TaxID=1871066 RepID=UPI000FE52E90|nr:hypothetical protein [Mesorhizobium sp.]RWE89584.1 MAG: hypothetical protein EOS68_32295 [Mesorhizobium sp.]RWO52352.1 MAG: hypothetical protein EOS14_34665 [Mesorhizobium sp.]TIN36395.1 MAG: hypothetical protein E5Y32_28135 [Mesorhizobium sp.]TIP86550.1 MAG: hypothetical protein E5X58_32355 [Mesorhizobium sp.]TIY09629.1 MAG: hypothetical protein E5V18_00015 [Mesorhizobium sp.]
MVGVRLGRKLSKHCLAHRARCPLGPVKYERRQRCRKGIGQCSERLRRDMGEAMVERSLNLCAHTPMNRNLDRFERPYHDHRYP